MELIWAVTGGGTLSNANRLLEIRKERQDMQKNWDDANDATLKGLVGDLKDIDRRLILRDNNTGTRLNLCGTTVTGNLLLAT